MNRRNFLKVLGLSALVPFIRLPKASPEPPNLIPTLTDKEVEKLKYEWTLSSNECSRYITYVSNAGDYKVIYVSNPYVAWENVPSLFERT